MDGSESGEEIEDLLPETGGHDDTFWYVAGAGATALFIGLFGLYEPLSFEPETLVVGGGITTALCLARLAIGRGW